MAELGYRLTGSSDLYERGGRRPYASVNFVTAPRRLHAARPRQLQRQAQRGQRRGQPRRRRRQPAPGTAAWRGRPTTPRSSALRERQKRNFLATLLLSQGVPMLCGGDEMGRTQQRQQQRLLPGQRDLLVRLAGVARGPARMLDFTRRLDRAAPRAPRVPPPPVLPGPPHPRLAR